MIIEIENNTYRNDAISIRTKDSAGDALDELLRSNSEELLGQYVKQWFPFTGIYIKGRTPKESDEADAIRDTRDLMLLVLKIRSLIDNGRCTRKAAEELGFTFGSDTLSYLQYDEDTPEGYLPYSWVDTGEEAITYSLTFLPSSNYLPRLVAGNTPTGPIVKMSTGREIKEGSLYAPEQKRRAADLEDENIYYVFSLEGKYDKKQLNELGTYLEMSIDSLVDLFLNKVSLHSEGGNIVASAGGNMTALWLELAGRMSQSRVTTCKVCGAPVFAGNERGTKREFCEYESCKTKFKRAKCFARYVNEERLSHKDAGRKARIAVKTAISILAKNGISVRSDKPDEE